MTVRLRRILPDGISRAYLPPPGMTPRLELTPGEGAEVYLEEELIGRVTHRPPYVLVQLQQRAEVPLTLYPRDSVTIYTPDNRQVALVKWASEDTLLVTLQSPNL